MGRLLDELKAYLATASENQLKADWDELKELNEFGPEMLCILDDQMQTIHYNHSEFEQSNAHENQDLYQNPCFYLAA